LLFDFELLMLNSFDWGGEAQRKLFHCINSLIFKLVVNLILLLVFIFYFIYFLYFFLFHKFVIVIVKLIYWNICKYLYLFFKILIIYYFYYRKLKNWFHFLNFCWNIHNFGRWLRNQNKILNL
jgi:hypothetical protein